MAIYDLGTASLAANGEVTGVGTTWKAPLTLIRVGATIVFKTEPVQIYTISEIISDTNITVYNPNSETVPAGTGYAILAHDGITVQGLAQDVAETLRYYQSRETEVSTAVDIFKDFDQDKFSNDVNQVNTQFGEIVAISGQVSSDASQVSTDKSAAAASALSASNSKDAAAISAQEAADYAASLDTQNLLRKDLALSDLTDKPLARDNLDVYSRVELNGLHVSPEYYGAVGDGISDDTAAFVNACMSGNNVKCKKGAVYNLTMTESNVIIPPAGVTIDLNGSTVVHNTTGFLVFLIRNQRTSIVNGNFKYRGSYPTSAVETTRYGITRPHEAAFTGFIGLNNNSYYTVIDNINVSGYTDSNLYDFVVCGYEGNFLRSRISNIHATHYACALINNFHNTHIENIFGTKRHNKSSNVYGPGHLLYIALDNGNASNLYEYGTLLSNESTMGYAGATVQTTGLNGARITNIVTTMNDVGSLSSKVGGKGFMIDTIYNKASASITQTQALVEIQTQSQAIISDGTISNVNVYLPDGNLSAVGYRHGGTNVKALNVNVYASATTRQNEVAQLVTAVSGDVDLTVHSDNASSRVLIASFHESTSVIKTTRNPITLTSGTSMGGQSWGECSLSTVTLKDNLNVSTSSVSVNDGTLRQCLFSYGDWSNGEFYGQVINQSVTTSLSLTVPLRMPPASVSSSDFNNLVYKVDVMAASLTGVQAVVSSHILFMTGAGGSVTMNVSDIYVKQTGSVSILPSVARNPNSITVSVTRQPGGENLRDMVVRVSMINSKPHI